MSTGIQWTDETWNPVVGCTQVSPGCAHCYAKHLHDMRHRASLAGKQVAPQYAVPFETVQLKPERLTAPFSWRAPRRVFVNSVSDLFHEEIPDEFVAEVFAVMALVRRHTFQVLTKRPLRARDLLLSDAFRQLVAAFVSEYALSRSDPLNRSRFDLRATAPDVEDDAEWPLPNVWLGVSVENQRFANERIPLLLQTPAAVHFLSCEPLLGPLDFDEVGSQGSEDGDPFSFSALTGTDGCDPPIPGIDWVIVGGESGKDARPCNVHDLTDIVAQCDLAGVPCFVKQMGARPVTPDLTHWNCPAGLLPSGSAYALRLRDSHGGDPAEWPEELRVRQFPTSKVPS